MLQEAGEIDRLVEQHDLPREVAVNPYTMITHEVRTFRSIVLDFQMKPNLVSFWGLLMLNK